MPKTKERLVNPAQEQRKLEKAKALKKGKAEVQARRNEKLARRNPERLQRQLDDLKALEGSGTIKPREKQILEGLEKDLRAIRKARDTLGDKVPISGNKSNFGQRGTGTDRADGTLLGKRGRDGERAPNKERYRAPSSGSDTDESVRRIPMPKDTPPPPPRRPREEIGTNANAEPVAGNRVVDRKPAEPAESAAHTQPKTTYESGPQIRDLRREAVGRFVPNVVRRKQDAVRGAGPLVEPEELDRLEQEGYGQQVTPQKIADPPSGRPVVSPAIPDHGIELRRLAEEEAQFRQEVKLVQIEEVQDEDLQT